MGSGIRLLIVLSLATAMVGCQDDQAVFKGEVKEYNLVVDKIDRVVEALVLDTSNLPIADPFAITDPVVKSKLAIELADDMAYAQFFDLVTDPMLVIAGNAVKAYPHPLLLNNYASMLFGSGSSEDALFFYLQALNQEPGNPVLLTNIANVYIEQDDFNAARQYAEQALLAVSDFGPAYQVLTTVNLKDEHSELAAETMVKSARHMFNEITVHHFDSFLEAVSGLDPEFDEYPLKEAFLDELYEIARTNVDTKSVKRSVDTPSGQIKIKPFPYIAGADDLINSQDYIKSESDKLSAQYAEYKSEAILYDRGYYKHLHPDPPVEGVYPIQKNMRQIYAYKVIESFYNFRLQKLHKQKLRMIKSLEKERSERLRQLKAVYTPQREQIKKDGDKANQQMLEGLLGLQSFDVMKSQKAALQLAQLDYEWQTKQFDAYKENANRLITECQNLYEATKKILEEFWLKSGGLLKYMTSDVVFQKLDTQRKMVVYDYISDPVDILADAANPLYMQKIEMDRAEYLVQVVQQTARAADRAQEIMEGDKKRREQQESMNPEFDKLEREAYETFPEVGDTPESSLSLSLFGFGGSLATNGDAYEYGGETPNGLVSGSVQKSMSNDEEKVTTLLSVQATANTEWFHNKKAIEQALKSGDKTGSAAGLLGGINFAVSETIRKGEYETNRTGHGVIDQGKVYIRERTVGSGPFSRTEKVEISKSTKMINDERGSRMSGVAELKRSVRYSFSFEARGAAISGGITVRE